MLERGKTYSDNSTISRFIENRKKMSDEDRSAEAGRLLEEIKTVDVDSAYDSVKSEIEKYHSLKKTSVFTWITRIAAIFVIPLLLLNIWNVHKLNKVKIAENDFTFQEISSPVGMKTHVVLPDGSDIWLNAGSKISYKIPFTGKTRNVTLAGEAFLHVKKIKDSQFVLNTEKTQVKVLGTKFNVKAYPEDDNIEVSLIEGSINFCFENGYGKKVFTKLTRGEHLVLNKSGKKISVKKEKLSKYILWHKNILVFDDTPLPEVAKTLERWYGVKVKITDDEIISYKFTSVFENETLTRVLELLELSSPITIKYTKGKINRSTLNYSKSIVLISKK